MNVVPRTSLVCLLTVVTLAAAAACSSSSSEGGAGSGGGSSSSGGSSSGLPGGDPPPGSVSVDFPPIAIAPGVENTQCVVLRLPNPTQIRVGSIHNVLGSGSHHLIVYRVNDTVEQKTPFDCDPFTDTLDPEKGSTLMVTQKSDDLLQLPPGVAFTLQPNQMVRLEMHYINPSSTEKTITARSDFVPIPESEYRDEADFLFIGNPDIAIAPMQRFVLGPTYLPLPTDLAGVSFFAITGHQHQYGTNVTVSTAANKDDPGTSVYNVPNWTWSEPKTETFATPFKVPAGGGFKFTCEWNNTSNQTLGFGESANDEMCFFWAYYFPSKGSKVCVHSKQAGGPEGLNLCCPGSALCSLIKNL